MFHRENLCQRRCHDPHYAQRQVETILDRPRKLLHEWRNSSHSRKCRIELICRRVIQLHVEGFSKRPVTQYIRRERQEPDAQVQDLLPMLLDVVAEALEMCMDDRLRRSDGALGEEHASGRPPLPMNMMVYCAKRAEIRTQHSSSRRPFVAWVRLSSVENIEPLWVGNVQFMRIDAYDGSVDSVHAVHLFGELPAYPLAQVEVSLVPLCCGSKFGSGELAEKMELDPMYGECDGV